MAKTTLRSNIAAFLFGCFLAAILLEIVLRIHNPFFIHVRFFDVALLRKRVEIHNIHSPGLDSYIEIHRNSLGFRGPDPPTDFDKYLTILTIGGSTTECEYQNDDKTWPALLAKQLGVSFDKVWLNNAGRQGHSTYGHLYLLNSYLRIHLRPKIATFLVGWNDLDQDIPTIRDDRDLVRLRFTTPGAIADSMAQHSELFNCLLTVARYVRYGSPPWRTIDPQFRLLPAKYLTLSTTTMEAAKKYRGDRCLPGYRSRLLAIIDKCRQNNIRPVFITQPFLFGEGKDDLTGVDLGRYTIWPGSNGQLEWEALEMFNDVLRETARQRNVPVIDLARQLPKSSRFFFDEGHFTNEGNKRVADLMYPQLREIIAEQYPQYIKRGIRGTTSPSAETVR